MKFILIVIFTLGILASQAQTEHLSLDQVISVAKTNSIRAKSALNRLNAGYWQYKLYKANYLPELRLSGTLPDLNRSIASTLLDDGSNAFISRANMLTSVDLGIYQRIAPTGADLFITSGLQRLDDLQSGDGSSYLSTPVNIGINQPLFTFNSYKWDRRISPLVYEESRRRYVEEMEVITMESIRFFFDLLNAQIQNRIATFNMSNIEKSFKIAQGRYRLGTIAENDLLQMELSLLESKNELAQSNLDMRDATMSLKTFLGMSQDGEINLSVPEKLYDVSIPPTTAIEYALQNRGDVIRFQRESIEAERDVAKAKIDQFQFNLRAQYGLTNQGAAINDSYHDPKDQQRVSFGVEIPILNWGKGKASRKMAQSNYELTMSNIEIARAQLEREVFLNAMEIPILIQKVATAAKADTIGQKRFDITSYRYETGKIDITEFNLAMKAKDNSKRNYINALRGYWMSFYRLRRNTLFDFVNNRTLIKE